MDHEIRPTAELYAAYREELNAERMTRHVRMGTLVALCLQTGFILLDWLAFPEHFGLFLGVRLGLDAVLAFIYFRLSSTHPVTSEVALCLTMGVGMLILIYATHAPESGYYAGLMLVFAGMGVMLPLTALQSAGICGPLLGAWVLSPLFTSQSVEWGTYGLHFVFLSAAAIICTASSAFLDRVRLTEFAQRKAIERARDELKQLDSAKARFSANVHHELRTPLTLMLAPLDALRGGDFGALAAPVSGILDTMHSNGRRLLKLINNLLDMSKVESREFKIVRCDFDLAALVGEVVDGARPLADRKEIALTGDGIDTPFSAVADPGALEKVVVNLVGNALKFTDAGGSIVVTLRGLEDGETQLSVADSGIGIPEDQLDKVFDRFAQVDGSSTRRHEGTGIGLSLAHELVELHGGRIWAESPGAGCGATLHVILPRGEVDAVEDEQVVRCSDGSALALGHSIEAVEAEIGIESDSDDDTFVEMERSVKRWEGANAGAGESANLQRGSHLDEDAPEVLIAEDNTDMRRLLAFLVSREFRVRIARNGREALDLIQENPPNLVLTDVMMPELSGTELCRAIKGNANTRNIPVVLVTSKAEREMKIEGLELGADDYVTKPFHPRELMARIRSLVRLHCLQSELAARNVELERALSELKLAEAQLVQSERLAAVGELAAGIAHEVNNPVNFAVNAARALASAVDEVGGVLEAVAALDWEDSSGLEARLAALQKMQSELQAGELVSDVAELSGIITEGLDRTHRLVGDLRDFASPGGGPHTEIDLRSALDSTTQMIGHQLATYGVQVRMEVPDSLPSLRGDSGALAQVFLNLLKNAAEAMEATGGSIDIEAAVVEGGIRITFRDDGPGMTSEVQQRLFEPFFTTKAAGRGTGLGLSVSRQIVSAHGGTLEVESSLGEGTSFELQLPLGGCGARDEVWEGQDAS